MTALGWMLLGSLVTPIFFNKQNLGVCRTVVLSGEGDRCCEVPGNAFSQVVLLFWW